MNSDFTKFFLFIVLALAVLVLVTDQRRPLANMPLAGDNETGETPTPEIDLVTSAQFANVPSNIMPPPLSLMTPTVGQQPYSDGDGT